MKDDLLDGATASGTYADGKGTCTIFPTEDVCGGEHPIIPDCTLDIDIPGYPKGLKVHQQ